MKGFFLNVYEEVYISSYSYVFINLQRLSGQKGDATAYIKVYIFYFHKFLNAGEHSSYDSLVTYYSFQKKKLYHFL